MRLRLNVCLGEKEVEVSSPIIKWNVVDFKENSEPQSLHS